MQVFGRLREGASPDVAQQELAPVAAAIKAEIGAQAFNGYFELVPMAAGFIGDEGTTLVWTLLIAVGFVLLIACANVSNLLLARSAYRVRETTLRSALGASRGRLVLHMIAEGFVISAIATAIGLLLASIALDGMQLAATRLLEDSPSWWRFEIDNRVAIVAVGAALLSTLIAGLPAAIRASRPSLDSLLRDGGRMGTGLAIGRIAWGLVVAEVALACLLLGVAALMTKSVLNATSSDVGVETDDIMTARVGLTDGTYVEREEQVRFWDTLLTRVQSQPGIQSASVTNSLPGHGTADGPVSIEGRDYGDVSTKPFVNYLTVSPTYFETFRIAPTQGRLFDGRDTLDSLSVVVINEFMARSMFPDESPIGKRILFDLDEEKTWYTIIGVVPNVVMDEDGTTDEGVYISVLQHPQRFMSIAVRGEGDPRGLVGAVRTALVADRPGPGALLAAHLRRVADDPHRGLPHHRHDVRRVRRRGAGARRRRALRRARLPRRPAHARDRRAPRAGRGRRPDPAHGHARERRADPARRGHRHDAAAPDGPRPRRHPRRREPLRPRHLQHGHRAHDHGRGHCDAGADAARAEGGSRGGIALRVIMAAIPGLTFPPQRTIATVLPA